MEREFHVPVAVENDVNAAAIGEGQFGAGRDFQDFLCITYGTGVGGAIVMNKGIYTGSACSAGEFGGIMIHPEDSVYGGTFLRMLREIRFHYSAGAEGHGLQPGPDNGRKIFARLDDPKGERHCEQLDR